VKNKIRERTEERLGELNALKVAGCAHVIKNTKNKTERQCCAAIGEGHEFFCAKHNKMPLGFAFGKFLNLQHIRDAVMTPDADLAPEDAWQKKVPYDTRQMAIKQLVDAYESSYALKRNGRITHFSVAYKKKKDKDSQMFRVNPDALKEGRWIFKSRLKNKAKIRMRKRDVLKVLAGCKPDGFVNVIKTRTGKWYMCMPMTWTPTYENAVFKSGFVDTGVRTFATVYSPESVTAKIGDDYSVNYLRPLAERVSHYQSLYSIAKHPGSETTYKHRAHLKRRMAKLRDKIKNRVAELHNKTANLLCAAFQNIFVPRLATQNMVKRGRRKINELTAEELLRLSHYKFLEKLKSYATAKCRNVFIISEPYTTKTCTACGVLNTTIGGSKVHVCRACGLRMDRDYQGARNNGLAIITRLAEQGGVVGA